MEKMFSKSEVEAMLQKALKDGKIKALSYSVGYVDFLLNPIAEHLEYIEENGWTHSENFFRLDAKRQTLLGIKEKLTKAITDLEKKDA